MVITFKGRAPSIIGALLLTSANYCVRGGAKVIGAESSSAGEAVLLGGEALHHNTALMGKMFPVLSQLFRR